MLELSESNIHLNATATNKLQAIEMAASALEQAGNVEQGYLQGMLGREQQTSTFLGNGIAIPHGTLETRSMVKKTGVQVFQFPQGIEWGEGNIAYVVIGIAARSDEHLALLRQLTHVLGDEDTAAQLTTLTDIEKFRAILLGESDSFSITEETLSLDIETQSLLTLTAINAGKLQQQSAVENSFVSEVVSNSALPLGKGLWVTDAVLGNVKNALAFSRAKTIFNHNGKAVKGVLTISAVKTLARLLDDEVQNILLSGNTQQILTALNGGKVPAVSAAQSEGQVATGAVIGTFTVRNEHGLHARPSAVLVNEVKKYTSKITVQNLTRETAPVSAKSLMKIVALGVTQGHRLRFVAEGDDAKQAIEALGKIIASGLGESVSAVSPAEPDTIEVSSEHAPQIHEENTGLPSDAIEAVFMIRNEHGLHARPSAVLVNEVKKYNASVAVQNLDRDTQLVSAKSLMKIVALGVVKGHRLRFVASGEEAQQAIDGIGAVIESGAKVATITLNAAYDLVGRLPRIEIGEVNTVETLGIFPAGKGINVAKVLKDLGVEVAVGGFLGEDNVGDFETLFKKQGLEDKFHRVAGKTRINVKITETEADVTDLNFLGYQITPEAWQQFTADSLAYCQHFDIVAVCGSLPRGVSPELFADWLNQLYQAGVKVVLDSSNAALTAGLKAHPWLVKPNHRELDGHPLNSLDEIIAAAKKLKAEGIANVIISMGADGSLWLSDQAVIQAQPPKCKNVVSTVGAGDSMVAGLIYGIEKGLSQAKTLAFASAVSAFAVSQSNVGVSDIALLEPILANVKISVIEG